MDRIEGSPVPRSADPAVHELYRRWAGQTRGCGLPSTADMDFEELLHRYPGAALISIERHADGTARYCFSRIGRGHRVALGRDIEGYSIDELVAPQQVAYYEDVYGRIVAEAQPHYWMRMNSLVGSDLHTFERLLVPVADDGRTVDALIGVWAWLDQRMTAA